MPMGVKEKVGYAWPRTVNIYREKIWGGALQFSPRYIILGCHQKDAL